MPTPKSSRVSYIVLRYMRQPILGLIAVYAISMAGWMLIPGPVGVDGRPQSMSLFHAFYFLTYTVTTTGFGELPYTFTEAQRMWGIVSLYAGVIAWFYALGSIVRLVQNPDFQQSVAERRFAKTVARIKEPFCIICGFGNTGALLTRGLSESGFTVVVIDNRPERIRTLMLRDYPTEVAGVCADARVPEHLIEAGMLKPNCKAVVTLTADEEVNLKISVSARLLNPEVWVATQSTSPAHEEALATLGEQVHIVDPFQTYAKYLGATIANPALHSLNQWLAGTPGARLEDMVNPPKGTWILCGFGRMGHWIRGALEAQGISIVIIEPEPMPEDAELPNLIVGRATQETLLAAGIETAAGIVAGTNNDSDNLSILLNARALNPEIFFVVRQNKYRNQVIFRAAKADVIMMPSLVGARRIRFLLIAPLMKTLFERLRDQGERQDEALLNRLMETLIERVGGSQPQVWTVDISPEASPALLRKAAAGRQVTLGNLISDPIDREHLLACVALVHRTGTAASVLPDAATPLHEGDQILFCGDRRAHRQIDANMSNDYTLDYLVTGIEEPRGWVMKWLQSKLSPPQPAE